MARESLRWALRLDHLSEHLDADHIFIGEAEGTLPKFVRV